MARLLCNSLTQKQEELGGGLSPQGHCAAPEPSLPSCSCLWVSGADRWDHCLGLAYH